ncbi:phosphatidylinositol-glycan biosynthesis class F protein [Ostrinia furnacalis]|uniref:phosphatidylinositol-glycan biosynthesis class F protein n=1 Tax=Ostrinia furnacalis TaxID=93504 RepID=UPI00103FAF36|nr:phosphatidylinositol-glycan biosynthesis class F protein [Ostrinia furnacalis]
MFTLNNQIIMESELRKVTISSLVTCIYLPSLVTFISYKGLLYSVGNASSFYMLALIFSAELLKSLYLNVSSDIQARKAKASKSRAGDILKSLLFLLVVLFSYFVGIILFGAPLLDSHEETLMLATLMTLLTVFPLIAHTGVEASMQLMFGLKTYGKDTIIQMLINNSLLAVAGAWLGAVVIPLDWNTPWQQWPIPCYLGAIGGYLLSNVLTVLKVCLMAAAQKYPSLNFVVNIMNTLHNTKSRI